MAGNKRWTRGQLLVAFALYSRLPFGRLHHRNPDVIRFARAMGRTPSALAMKLTNIASLDPEITSSGRTGLRGVSRNDREMWEEMHDDWANFAVECWRAVADLADANPTDDELRDTSTLQSGESRIIEAKARIGQHFFRNAVLSAYDGQCCVTGLNMPTLLRAGHIVPWSIDPDNRVNPRNGLLLSILHERAFDAGLFTISDALTVVVSESFRQSDDPFFVQAIESYHGHPVALPRKFVPDPKFLAFHRKEIFRP